jgi:hypothetical protein
MRLMQKTYLLLLQIGMPLANASKICRIPKTNTVLFPTIGNVVNVQSPDIGKPDIHCKKDWVSRQPISVIIGHPDKKLLPTYLNF